MLQNQVLKCRLELVLSPPRLAQLAPLFALPRFAQVPKALVPEAHMQKGKKQMINKEN